MSDIVFNIALGRAAELYRRVIAGDPAGSALLLVALKAENLEADETLRDWDTLADIITTGSSREATNTGYSRKVIAAGDLTPPTPNDSSNYVLLDLPDTTWNAVQSDGGAWGKILVCYRPGTAPADSAIIPLTGHDFPITPDGTAIVAQVDPNGFFAAQA